MVSPVDTVLRRLRQQPRKAVSLLSLNPAVDITYEVPKLLIDQKVHAERTRYDPGGNGINVARSLKILGIEVSHVCVIAGQIGSLLQQLLEGKIGTIEYFSVAGETRINGTILERLLQHQYEVSGIGPIIKENILCDILNRYIDRLAGGIGVLTGSTPVCVRETLYAELISRIQQQGGQAFVDSHDEPLIHAVGAYPFLIKPNRYEFETLLGRKLASIQEVAEAAREVQASGISQVCVSLGKEGVVLATADAALHAEAPIVKVDSSVGAGDSMVAGLVAGFATDLDLADTLRLAVACSAGTVRHPGTALFTLQDIRDLYGKVHCRTL